MARRNQKWVFLEAFVLAILVFGIGIALGFTIETLRVGKIADVYKQSELDLLDVKLQTQLYEMTAELDCEEALKSNVEFADRVYEEARQLDRYEGAQRLTQQLLIQHKKYDLLRMSFWINSLKIKEKCDAKYNNVVYFFQYNEATLNTKARQAVFARVLEEVKEKKGNEVMLIPIAGDLDISSVNFIREVYDIDTLPTILINEKIKITELTTEAEILSLLE